MTNEERKVFELAQEGVEIHAPNSPEYIVCAALIEALAQPEQEPVAYTNSTDVILAKHWTADYPPEGWEPLGYTTPPQRKPLTYGQILAANYPDGEENGPTIAAPDFELICFARQIEAAHGIKE